MHSLKKQLYGKSYSQTCRVHLNTYLFQIHQAMRFKSRDKDAVRLQSRDGFSTVSVFILLCGKDPNMLPKAAAFLHELEYLKSLYAAPSPVLGMQSLLLNRACDKKWLHWNE